jgi:tetratricopeptide (TPR) repeat protein
MISGLSLAAAFLLIAATPTEPVVVHPLPDQLGADIREEVAGARQDVERLEAEEAPPAARARAWGELGRLYQSYQFLDAAEGSYRKALELEPRRFEWLYLLGVLRHRRQDLDPARAVLEEARRERPRDVPTLLRLGEVLLLLRQPEGAAELATLVLELEPELAAPHFLAGRAAAQEKKWEEAVAHFRRALALEPEADRIHYPLAMALQQVDRTEEAREHLRMAGDIDPEVPDPLAASLSAENAASFLIRGGRAHRQGDFESAEAAFRRAQELDPANPAVVRGLGGVLLARGHTAEAVEVFRRLVELLPDDRAAKADLGIALLRDARLEEALELLGESAGGAPEEPEIRYRYAQALMVAERLEDALAEMNAVLELDPTSSAARADRARLLIATGNPEQGIEELRRYLTEFNGEPLLFLYLAEAQVLVERLPAAAETLATATERFPEDPEVGASRARFLSTAPEPALRDPATALEIASRLFEEEPSPGHAQLMAMALAASGRFSEAVQWQTQLLQRAGEGGAPEWVLDVLRQDLERYRRRELADFSLVAGVGRP